MTRRYSYWVAIVALAHACGPTTRTGDGSAGASGSGGSTETGSLDASETGAPFECAGARWFQGDLIVDSATDVDSLRDIGGITGGLGVHGTTGLPDLGFLSCLERIGGGVSISSNTALKSLAGLERLSDPAGLSIVNNDALVRLDALASVSGVGPITINGNATLSDISLPALEQASSFGIGACDSTGGLRPDDNPLLTTIGEFPRLQRVDRVGVRSQSGFSSLDSLHALVDRGVEIDAATFVGNPALPVAEVEAFAQATGIQVESCENLDEEPCLTCGSPD